MSQPADAVLAIRPVLLDGTMTDALVAVLLTQVRGLRALVETHEQGIDPASEAARLHERLIAMEERLEARRPSRHAEECEPEIFYLD